MYLWWKWPIVGLSIGGATPNIYCIGYYHVSHIFETISDPTSLVGCVGMCYEPTGTTCPPSSKLPDFSVSQESLTDYFFSKKNSLIFLTSLFNKSIGGITSHMCDWGLIECGSFKPTYHWNFYFCWSHSSKIHWLFHKLLYYEVFCVKCGVDVRGQTKTTPTYF